MAAFSYTAPIFTEKQEREEAASITDEEKKSIRIDVFGVDKSIEETEEVLERSLARFAEEIDAISDDNKKVYMVALQRCPNIVDQESPPIRFLRAENYDARNGAIRLTKYWESRLDLFGPERAFLPMTQSGAMKDDMDCFDVLLDENHMLPHDNRGRAVWFSNKGCRNVERLGKRQQLRILWYYVHTALEVESVQTSGFVLLVGLHINMHTQLNRSLLRMEVLHFRDVLPSTLRAVHFFQVSSFAKEWLLPSVKFLLGRRLRLRLIIHAPTQQEDIVKYAFNAANIPVCCGGTYKYNQTKWLEARRLLEESRRCGDAVPITMLKS